MRKLFLIMILVSCFYACKTAGTDEFVYDAVSPVDFPAVNIPGFTFPQDSNTLRKWITGLPENKAYQDSIYLHGWGIWTGLTSLTNQYTNGDSVPLRVYETWLTPEEMIDSIKGITVRRSNRANLKIPRQFIHAMKKTGSLQSVNDSIHESVSYSPGAAQFAMSNKIFMATALYQYQQSQEIPFFPNNAITIKPVFKVLPASSGKKTFNIAAWKGPTQELIGFPEKDWNSFVTINIGSEKVDGAFGLNDFIHYRLNAEDAYFFNKQFTENSGNPFNAKAGDIAVLVAMHVGTREVTNWTWQTFWWEANPDNPPAPSSSAIAAMRPKSLTGAARHYAMSVAYYMVNPKEPYSGNNVTGEPMYAFNPYLEAGFTPKVFSAADSLNYVLLPNGQKVRTYVGVRTNCMSCHRMASINVDSLAGQNNSFTPYIGNAYVSRNDTLFKGQLLLDFAWSVQGNIDTTGLAAYMQKQKGK